MKALNIGPYLRYSGQQAVCHSTCPFGGERFFERSSAYSAGARGLFTRAQGPARFKEAPLTRRQRHQDTLQ
jgi:hypothetical protein